MTGCEHGKLTDSGVCQCEEIWYGVRCTEMNCQHGVSTHNSSSSYCHCNEDYAGPSCDIYTGQTTPLYEYQNESRSSWTQHPVFLGALALFAVVSLICIVKFVKGKHDSRNSNPMNLLLCFPKTPGFLQLQEDRMFDRRYTVT